ncbi:aminotransferase class III-fold pyridoxal phosphate-dependent enzyme [Candidatus Pelagibacter sp.]|nr:aminotransferase class III-fold pyridoxal phosphate-dependent enzyme [Candidatus Pelagibacter sp.]
MAKYILNEGYYKNLEFFSKGNNVDIFSNKIKYIDLSMCAGSILLGHNHNIFRKSIKDFLKKKISNFAAPNIYAQKFSYNIKKVLPNTSGIIFCNSGTEAVIKSLRIARALNNKKKIALVSGGWHGSVDQLLFKSGKNFKVERLSNGLTAEFKKNIIIIPYNDINKTKEILNRHKKNISCIIIEPIQGSLPYLEIKGYLKFLEKYSKINKITLIFDEMITGLRTDCSSVQNFFSIKPDISIFGKCFGGGLPIGFISLSKKIRVKMDKMKLKVFFGGTFSGNSINMYVGNEILKYIISNKKKIFKKINNNAEYFTNSLNNFFSEKKIDLKVYRFKSMMRLVYTNQSLKDRYSRDFIEKNKSKSILNFKKYIRDKGIYLPSSGIIFFSYSHSIGNIKYLINIFKTGSLKFFNPK